MCEDAPSINVCVRTLPPSMCVCVCVCLSADIGSWLQLFGFQLHNVVPGFPKPDVTGTEQTYELMKMQTKTQDWDSSKVNTRESTQRMTQRMTQRKREEERGVVKERCSDSERYIVKVGIFTLDCNLEG